MILAFLRRGLLEAIKLYDLWKIKNESWQRREEREKKKTGPVVGVGERGSCPFHVRRLLICATCFGEEIIPASTSKESRLSNTGSPIKHLKAMPKLSVSNNPSVMPTNFISVTYEDLPTIFM
jgi:hypothetical protein